MEQQWLTASEKAIALLDRLSDDKREEVLDFARFLIQKIENLATEAKNAIGNI
ncbi:MAG: DUF2281 domain-containing protein [Cyanobacteria bacterium SID2]|nr:DUF2281 domain-containing protein [Cyanobacteria bacterium SID2]